MKVATLTAHRRLMLAAAAAAVITGAAVATGIVSSQPASAQISVESVTPLSFADLVEAVRPAVVSIRVRAEIETRSGPRGGQFQFDFPDMPEGSPFNDFFREFEERFGNRAPQGDDSQRPQRRRFAEAVGSGFVISAEGFVVTNNHVIDEADEVLVIMDDGEERLATVVGTDPRTDLALLKIEAASGLPYVEFADQDVRVGDWVVAVGNPFGLGGTFTAGIVSARGRDINANAYDDFIQIDAAVNRGNSGGPAFDVNGNVVGVNTAIFSPNGGSIGIAFAIPAATAKQVVFDLMDDGNVTRGFLGVSIQDVSDDLAASLGLDSSNGSMVTEPRPDSPAQRAGIRSGDVIVGVNGETIENSRDLSRTIGSMDPGTEVDIGLWRDGSETTVTVTLAELSEEQPLEAVPESAPAPAEPEPTTTSTGMTLLPNEDGDGVVVAEIEPDSIAASKGLRPGDVVLEANSTPIASASDFQDAVDAVLNDGRTTMLVKVSRNGDVRFVGLPLEEAG